MEVFETVLYGTDGPIDGLVSTESHLEMNKLYTFSSLDGSLTLVIAKDDQQNWRRVSGTEPYLSGWVEELGEKIDQRATSDSTF